MPLPHEELSHAHSTARCRAARVLSSQRTVLPDCVGALQDTSCCLVSRAPLNKMKWLEGCKGAVKEGTDGLGVVKTTVVPACVGVVQDGDLSRCRVASAPLKKVAVPGCVGTTEAKCSQATIAPSKKVAVLGCVGAMATRRSWAASSLRCGDG